MNAILPRTLLLSTLLIAALPDADAAPRSDAGAVAATAIPVAPLPAPVCNNAVALVGVDGEDRLYSFLGLGAGKRWQDISRAAYAWSPSQGQWRELAPVPVTQGRLASVAAVAGGRIYLRSDKWRYCIGK